MQCWPLKIQYNGPLHKTAANYYVSAHITALKNESSELITNDNCAMKASIKHIILLIFNHIMAFLSRHPQLRKTGIDFLRSTGILKRLKKMYFVHYLDRNNALSPYMIGPVIAIDITENQLTERGRKIYQELNQQLIITKKNRVE